MGRGAATVSADAPASMAAAATEADDGLRKYSATLGLRVLERVGFGPLSRPTFLRIGFRDICRDLDLHEGTSIRFVLGPGRLTRAHLDYDACSLVFQTVFREPDQALELALTNAFPAAGIHRDEPIGETGSIAYHVRLPIPTTLSETRQVLARMRRGLAGLTARFEPQRFAALEEVLEAFGARETLAGLSIHEPLQSRVPIPSVYASSSVVH